MDQIQACRHRRATTPRQSRPMNYSYERGLPINNLFDGIIGASQQNLGSGDYRGPEDCWFLSSLNAIARTRRGAEIIRNSLHYRGNEVIVTLQGVGESYRFTREQIRSRDDLSQGDPDVRAFEMAAEAHRAYVIKHRSWGQFTFGNRHDFRHDVGDGTEYNPLPESKFTDEGLAYLSANGKIYNYADTSEGDYTKANGFSHNKATIPAMLDVIASNPGRFAATVAFSRQVGEVPYKHECTVVSSDAENVRLINPNDSSKIITVKRSEFLKGVHLMSVIDMEPEQR